MCTTMTKSFIFRAFLLYLAFVISDVLRVDAFSAFGGGATLRTLPKRLSNIKPLYHSGKDDEIPCRQNDCNESDMSRRAVFRNALMISATTSLTGPFPAVAYPGETITNTEVDLDCLKDLPPIEDGYIRLYLCRHGQTENNRLRIVQGARVDPPVNINGEAQATNLGLALGRADPKPELFFSSSLLRARMTAEIAANANLPVSSMDRIKPKELSSLAEIDFGPVADGQPISAVQDKMMKAYTEWAMGNVDFRPEGGGDNGREVLSRVCEALETLVNEAKAADVACVAAVTHSAYLRALVGVVLDEPLIQSSVRKIRNGSVTVIDVPKDLRSRALGPKPKLLGGLLSRKPEDFSLSIPVCKAVRINEVRHLPLDKI